MARFENYCPDNLEDPEAGGDQPARASNAEEFNPQITPIDTDTGMTEREITPVDTDS